MELVAHVLTFLYSFKNIKKNKYKIKNELILPPIGKIVSTFLTEVNW